MPFFEGPRWVCIREGDLLQDTYQIKEQSGPPDIAWGGISHIFERAPDLVIFGLFRRLFPGDALNAGSSVPEVPMDPGLKGVWTVREDGAGPGWCLVCKAQIEDPVEMIHNDRTAVVFVFSVFFSTSSSCSGGPGQTDHDRARAFVLERGEAELRANAAVWLCECWRNCLI